jgi:pimeloyl-ACP methyl ester carboxylesterase
MRMEQVRPSVLYGDFVACNNFDIMDSLSSIKVPTLVLCGQEDEMTPLRFSQYLSDNIPASDLKVIPKAGHMVMLEQSQPVAQTMAEFLSAVPFQPGLI